MLVYAICGAWNKRTKTFYMHNGKNGRRTSREGIKRPMNSAHKYEKMGFKMDRLHGTVNSSWNFRQTTHVYSKVIALKFAECHLSSIIFMSEAWMNEWMKVKNKRKIFSHVLYTPQTMCATIDLGSYFFFFFIFFYFSFIFHSAQNKRKFNGDVKRWRKQKPSISQWIAQQRDDELCSTLLLLLFAFAIGIICTQYGE